MSSSCRVVRTSTGREEVQCNMSLRRSSYSEALVSENKENLEGISERERALRLFI